MSALRWLLAFAALVGIPATSAVPEPPAGEDAAPDVVAERAGSTAPADAWPVEGGCSARTGASRARPLRGPLVVAWTFEVKGTIEEEPRVWKEKCFVCERTPDSKRVLHVVGIRDGAERYKQRFETVAFPLSPAVGAREVVLNGDRGLEGWAIGEHMLTKHWTAKDAVRAFVRRGETLWVVEDRSVVRCEVGRGPDRDPTVQSVEKSLAPAIAVRGDTVYVVGWDAQGNVDVLAFDDRSLAPRGSTFIGNDPAGTFSRASIAAGTTDVFVRAENELATSGGAPANTVWLTLESGGTARTAGLVEMPSLPACPRSGFIASWGGDAESRDLVRPAAAKGPDGRPLFEVFVKASERPDYVDVRVQPTTVGSIVYLGGRCFDADTREVLREDEFASPFRVVPARDLLLVASGSRVTAYREARAPMAATALPLRAPADAPAGPFPLDAVVLALADGSTRSGAFSVDLAGGTLAPTAKGGDKGKIRLDAVLAIATAAVPRRLLLARDRSSAVEGLDAIVERDAAKEWLAAARQALAAGSADDARDLLTQAAARGADEAEVEKTRAAADVQKPKPPDAKRLAAVGDAVAGLRARGLAALWGAFEQLPADAPFALRAGLVRETLRRDPNHAGAVAWVRAGVTAGIPVPEPFDAGEWLHFVEAVHGVPVTLVVPPTKGEKDLAYPRRQLGSALHFWRQDLVGIESGPLLVLTPVNRPARIAKCLGAGRQVCDFLEALFAGGTVKRDTRYPLTHLLFETKEEYLVESTKHGRGQREEDLRTIENSAGHYDPTEEVSRMYLPPDDEDFVRVVATYTHELTHHWMDQRCPRFGGTERVAEGGRGYWVVEGIAEYVSELRYDFTGESPPAPDPRAFSVDVVAHASPESLHRWSSLFDLDSDAARRLSHEANTVVPMRWKLGWSRKVSPTAFFYAQASAASHYLLLAENGRWREAYLTYAADHYRGHVEPGAIEQRFGVPPDELGARIVAWCRERAGKPGK